MLVGEEALPPVSAARACCAFVWGATALRYGASLLAVEIALLCLALLAASLADLAAMVIPNACVAAALGLRVAYVLVAGLFGWEDPTALLRESVAGAIVALVPLLALTYATDRVLDVESMGGGDLKLLAVAGMYVGWRSLPFLLVVACLGGLASSAVRSRGAMEPFPFGPAIAGATWIALMLEPFLDAWMRVYVA